MVAAVRGFQCGSEASASAGQNSILWQTDSRLHYMYLPPLSTTLISCPHFPTSLLFCEEGERETDKAASSESTYHSLPMYSPLLSEKCWICQSNSTERIYELNFSCPFFKWVKYFKCMDIRVHAAYLKWETNYTLRLLLTFFLDWDLPRVRNFTTPRSEDIHHQQQSGPDLYRGKIALWGCSVVSLSYILHNC